MGILSAFELIATARSQGLELTESDGKLRVTGPRSAGAALAGQLRERRDDIIEALSHSPRICAHCDSDRVALVTWAEEPFCRPCAQRVGLELLTDEAPSVLDRRPPILDDTPPPSQRGCIVDPEGNTWALHCRCGLHDPPGAKGHDAQPVNYIPEATHV